MSLIGDCLWRVLSSRASCGTSVRISDGISGSGGLSLAITRFASLSWP